MPLLFDMPLEECKKYKGINPKPADFDEYWDSSVEEMKNTDPCFEMIPSKFKFSNTEIYDIYWTGVDGARIHGKLAKSKNLNKPAPCVIHAHGYACYPIDFSRLLMFAAEGYVGISVDCRGQRGLSEDTGGVKGSTLWGHIVRGMDNEDPKKLLMRNVFLDHAQIAGIMMNCPDIDETKVYVCGGSQGGGLSLAAAALEPRISKIYASVPFLSDYKRIWNIDQAKDAYRELTEYFRYYDPLHEREEEIFTKLGYIDVHNLAPRIRGKVVICTGLMDTICPPSSQFAIFNNIVSEKKSMIWPDFGHEEFVDVDNYMLQFFAE